MVEIVTGIGLGVERSSGWVLGANGQLGDASFNRYGENVYVNAATGNLVINRTDEILLGRGESDVIQRTYNSLGPQHYDTADNWMFSAQRAVTGVTGTIGASGSSVQMTDWDGSDLTFTHLSGNVYENTAGAGPYDTITYSATTGQWDWLDGSSQINEFYDGSTGRLLFAQDQDGNVTNYTYNTSGQLWYITTANGETTTFNWTGNEINWIQTSLVDSTSLTRVYYGYDPSGRLATVTTDLSPTDGSISDGNVVTTTYSYDSSNRVISIQQTGGAELDIHYDATTGKVSKLIQTTSSGYLAQTLFAYSSGSTAITDPLGQVTTLTYDSSNQLTQVSLPAAQTGTAGQVISYTYDSNGNVLTATDGLGNITSYQYDGDGNVIQMVDAAGNTTTRYYSSGTNQLLTETVYRTPATLGTGGTIVTAASQPATTRYTYYSTDGRLHYAISALGEVTQYTYDSVGRLTSSITYRDNTYSLTGLGVNDPISESALNTWVGAITDKSDALRTDYLYDTRNMLGRTTTYSQVDSSGNGVTTAPYSRVLYLFDQAGNLLSKQTVGFNSEVYTYDGLNRMKTAVDLTGGTTSVAFTDASNTIAVTMANGMVQTTLYDDAGEAISIARTDGTTTKTVQYFYDKDGRLRMITDALGNTTYYLYDTVGRRVAMIAPDRSMTRYVYDADNRLVDTVHYTNLVTSASLLNLVDTSGQPKNVTYTNFLPTAASTDIHSWQIYDSANRLIETIDDDGDATVFAYDGDSNLISMTSYANAVSVTGFATTPPTTLQYPTLDATRDVVSRNFYDDDGRLIGTLDGAGYLTQILYDTAGEKTDDIAYATATTSSLRASGSFSDLLTSVGTSADDLHTRYVYDSRGYLRYELDSALRVTEFVYDANGNVIHTTRYGTALGSTPANYTYATIGTAVTGMAASALTETSWSVYDATDRLVYSIDAANQVTSYTYGYDSTGTTVKTVRYAALRTTTADPSAGTMATWVTAHANATNDRTTRALYDKFGQLIYDVDAESYITQYGYDADGNTTLVTRYADRYTVGDSDTISTVASAIGTPTTAIKTQYSYDGNGRLTDTIDGDGFDTHVVYNTLGEVSQRTVAYGTSDAVSTSYAYDAAGRVASETAGSGAVTMTVAYTYDGLGRVTAETDASGTSDAVTTVHNYDKDGNDTSDVYASGVTGVQTTTSYTYDAFGHVLTKTDGRGTTATYTYDALGRLSTMSVPLDTSSNAVTTYSYDVLDNLIETSVANSAVSGVAYNTFYFYDALNRVNLMVDADGYATATTYNRDSAIASTTHYFTQITAAITAGTRPTVTVNATYDATTSFTRDKLDRVTAETDAMGATQSFGLDSFGNQLTVTNQLGGVTTNVFDGRGLMVSSTKAMNSYKADGTLESSTVEATYAYDGRGNLTTMVEASGLADQRTTAYAYDALNRLIQTQDSDSLSIVSTSDFVTTTSVLLTTTIKYDGRGNVIEQDDATGARTLFYYDALNRKIAQINAIGTLTDYTYDTDGNMTKVMVYATPVTLPTTPGGTPPSGSGDARETDYAYDLGNRLKTTTTVASLRTGDLSTKFSTVGNLTTTDTYDVNGNVIEQTDGRGNNIFTYYDKMGRKIAQVDQDGYITAWVLDDNGNVTSETRFATRLTSTPTTSTIPTVASDAVNDRVTNFTYDKDGRRLTETRTGVVAYTINGTSGAATTASTNSVVTYTYNALGEVLTKAEATGDTTTYTYDTFGRQITATGPSFTDFSGTSVQGAVTEAYDGLNNLVRTVQNSTRVTSYVYDKGGRLTSMTDADGFVRYYEYDADGRTVVTKYTRHDSANNPIYEAQVTAYNAVGNTVLQSAGTSNSGFTTMTLGDVTHMQYDAFGEMTARGINTTSQWQETFSYDDGGRLWRTTSGDGSVRLFGYDAGGNQTLEIDSSGAALPSGYAWGAITLDQAISLLTNSGVSNVGTVAVAGMTVTMTGYDARNQATEILQSQRQLGASTSDISTFKSYDAFGEVASETDGNGNTTNFVYNTMGKVISQVNPSVSYTSENGTVASASPTTTNYYDLSGRLVGVVDANGNVNTRTLLAGTGYDGQDALVAKEFHADGGIYTNKYDVFDDLRQTVNEVGKTESYQYDAMDRLTQETHQTRPNGTIGNSTGSDITLIDNYTYDELGQRITHYNNLLTSSATETTDYDLQGRVVKMVDLGGDTTTYAYSWSMGATTTGLGDFGGWTMTTTNPAGLTATVTTDYFGRTIDKVDFGPSGFPGFHFSYNYDLAGRLTQTTSDEGEDLVYTYYNTGELASQDSPYLYDVTSYDEGEIIHTPTDADQISTYQYDKDGNRTLETYSDTQFGSYQSASMTWDAMNRRTSYTDTGGVGGALATLGAPASVTWVYDLDGNIRNMNATFRTIASNGTISTGTTSESYWYKYDTMNRFVTTEGTFTGTAGSGTISRGTAGIGKDISYDAAGERLTMTLTNGSTDTKETYIYTADGYLAEVKTGSHISATYADDAMGRVKYYQEYNTAGASVYSRYAVYDANSETTGDDVITTRSDGTAVETSTSYDYDAASSPGVYAGAYQGGVVTHTHAVTTTWAAAGALSSEVYSDTVNSYTWWDSAQLSTVLYTPDVSHPSTVNTSAYAYDTRGNLLSVRIVDGRPRTINFIDNSDGMVMQRHEVDDSGANAPREFHYYFNSVPMGDISNNGTSDVDYAVSITDHTQLPAGSGAFQNGATSGTPYEDFDTSYDPINGLNYDSTASTYTVAAGDTLESIAQQVWGDSSFWYMIADANGLSSDADLTTGMDLVLPDKIHDIHNSSTTYQVYDPNEATGDTSPTVPRVHNHGGCGIVGEIVMAVVAVVVTYFTAGAASGLIGTMMTTAEGTIGATVASVGGAAIGAAVGSIVSQGVGMAMGMQKGLNWDAVALAGISAGVGADVGGISGLSDNAFVAGFERGVIGNVVTQGIGLATGLQKKFDWAGVAAAGVSAGVGGALGPGDSPLNNFGRGLIAGMAGDIVGAAIRTLTNGSDFGDNIIRSLPDAIGQGVGAALALPVITDSPPIQPFTNFAPINPPLKQLPDISFGDSGESTSPTASASPGSSPSTPSDPGLYQDANGVWHDNNGEVVIVTGTKPPDGSMAAASATTIGGGMAPPTLYHTGEMDSKTREAILEKEALGKGGKDEGLDNSLHDVNGKKVSAQEYSYSDGRIVKLLNVYVAGLPNPDGTSFALQYFDTREQLNDFLQSSAGENWQERYGLSDTTNDITYLYAGAANPGFTGSSAANFVFDGTSHYISVPADQWVELVYWHEYSHLMAGIPTTPVGEGEAWKYGLQKIGLYSGH
jgi:YD repeat-containing protein